MKNLMITAILTVASALPSGKARAQETQHAKVKTLLIENLPDPAACAAVQTAMEESISQLEQQNILPSGAIVAKANWKTFCHKRCDSACVAKVTEPPGFKVSFEHGKLLAGSDRISECEQEQLKLPDNSLILWSGVTDAFNFFRYRCWLNAIVIYPSIRAGADIPYKSY